MKSWTLIPFYLWKNTFRRWFEHPVSPLSKILIPALLGLLAVVVLALFGQIERELRLQLEKASVYAVYVSEFVSGENAPTLLRKSYEDEVMWQQRYGHGTVKQLRQPLASAVWKDNQVLPVFGYTSSVDVAGGEEAVPDPPVAWLLTDAAGARQWEPVDIAGKRSITRSAALPPWLAKGMSVTDAVLAPVEMVEPLLNKGFINHTLADFSSIGEVRQFVAEVSAYHRADKRQIKITSALEILRNLERITAIQRIVRSLIVAGCGIILALVLGSIAWLEYRQDAYLLALLKSFGTPSFLLLAHMFFENLLLVFAGIGLARLVWQPLFGASAARLHEIGLQAAGAPPLPASDVAMIFLAGGVGVLLAMVPVAFGLRRPAGLILQ